METNQLDSDLHLPPRKRLLAGFKKLNGSSSSSSPPSAFASSSSTSNSNGSSSSSSTNLNTHLGDLLALRFNNQSPEELAEAARSAAALAVKAAKAAREVANEKALVSAKAIAAAKRALELVDSFPKEAMTDCKERRSHKKKKHVPLQHLYSKGEEFRDEEEEEYLASRLHRAVDKRYPKVLGTRSSFEENGQINKKQKTVVGVVGTVNDVAGVVDSDSSFERLESNREEAFKPDEVDSIPTPGKEESNSLQRRRGRVKLKKLPLSIL
ncbi:PHD finger-like protein [Hirschfeldia incana]|nr:PHD finger-like protein [Hirschfeldia incana]